MFPLLGRDRHYLYVIGQNAPDTVDSVGGWLFDQALAGWEVTVFVRESCDAWPLRILGAQTAAYESAESAIQECPGHGALAVAAALYDQDPSVRQVVRSTLYEDCCDVTTWGNTKSTWLSTLSSPVSYRLGPAARRFKNHTLAAMTRQACNNAAIEVFYTTDVPPAKRQSAYAGPYLMKHASRETVMP